jgi:hypothetical protein
VYLLTAVKVPKNFIKEFDKIRRRFLWAGDKELSGGKCKVAWVRVCTPTDYGALVWWRWKDSVELSNFAGSGSPGREKIGRGNEWSFRWTTGT